MIGPGSVIAGCEVVEPLGRGASSSVFRARWRGGREALPLPEGREVAAKVVRLSPGAAGAEERAALRREAEAGHGLSDPHLVAVHGLLDARLSDGAPACVLVCDLAEGRDLARALAEEGPRGEADLRRIAAQVARALTALHAAGLVHRDLKPANLVEAKDGTVRLVDLGFATSLDATSEDGLTGTLPYAAPEQFLEGGRVDARTDLYALGATLHELAAGEPPFGRGGPLRLMRRHLEESPVPLRARGVVVGEAFEALVLDLLAKDPDRRPSGAREVLDRLAGRGRARPVEFRRPGARGPATRDEDLYPLVGRSAEIAALEDAIATAGPGSVLGLLGEAGSGKSRLLCEVILPRGGAIARAGGDGAAPLLAAWLGGLLGAGRATGAIDLLDRVPALRPPVERLLAGERFAAAVPIGLAALRAAIDRSERTPVLALDDAHLLTPTECEAVRELVAGRGDRPWLLVLAMREAEASEDARGLLAGAHSVPLARLGAADIDGLAAAAGAAAALRSVLGPPLLAASGGLPGPATRLLRRLAAQRAFEPGTERWNLLLDPSAAADGGRMDAEAVLARIAIDLRPTLLAAAVLGPRFDPAVLARATGEHPVRLFRRLAVLQHEHRLLLPDGDRFRFDPALLAAGLRERVPARERQAIHARAADVEPAGSPERVRHLALSGRADEALASAAGAVDRLRAQGRHDSGLRLADEVLLAAGGGRDRAARFDILFARIQCLKLLPGREGIRDAFAALASAVRGLDPTRRIRAAEDAAGIHLFLDSDPRRYRRALRRASRIARVAGDERARLRIFQRVVDAEVETALASPRSAFLLRILLARVGSANDPAVLSSSLRTAMNHARVRGRPVEALRFLRAARAARGGDPRASRSSDRQQVAETLVRAGRPAAALRWNERARAAAHEAGLVGEQVGLGLQRCAILISLSRVADASAVLEEIEPLVRAFRERRRSHNLRQARSWVLEGEGRHEEAYAILADLARGLAATDLPVHRCWLPARAAQAAAWLARRREAAEWLRIARRSGFRGPDATMVLREALAAAAWRGGRFDRAVRHLLRAAEPSLLCSRTGARLSLARAAGLKVRAGKPDRALARRAWEAVDRGEEPLHRALAAAALAAATPGDPLLAARARALARRLGDPGDPDGPLLGYLLSLLPPEDGAPA